MRPGQVCLAVPQDSGVLARIHAACFPQGWSAQDIAGWLERSDTLGWVCRVREMAVGFILVQDLGEAADILTLAVEPDWRRRGVALGLVEAGARAMHARGAGRLLLDVRADNTAALGLYQRMGFAPDGVRRGYYRGEDGGVCDAVLMSLALGALPGSPG